LKAKIRGIYTTALTHLLLNNGFEIVQPSLTTKKRFGLSDNMEIPDVKIKDRYDLQGVRILGTSDAVNILQSIIHSEFEDALTRKWHVSVDGIYKGKITHWDEENVYVDLGNDVVGLLPKPKFLIIKNMPLLVQVERKRIGAKQPILTTDLKIVGTYAILAQNSKIGVSLKIRDLTKRTELYALGKTLAPPNWGIIWRESSQNQPQEALEIEIKTLAEKVRTLNEKATHTEAPAILIEGLYFMDVEFPWISKSKMDSLRAFAAPTLEGHHFYKSCGGKISASLEMAEKLLEKGENKDEVAEAFMEQIQYEFPEKGSLVDIEHVKLSGMTFHLGQATIENIDDEEIKYNRTVQGNGFYDGLNVKKNPGDMVVSETKKGEWFIITKYFSSGGEWKGTYINLNTPVELYPKSIRYVDLEVDICISPDGVVKVLDMEKLEKALKKEIIPPKLYGKVKEKVEQIMKSTIVQNEASRNR